MTSEPLVDELLTLWRFLQRASHPVRRGEMTPERYWLLRVVNRRGPLSIGDLADVLGITPSSVTTACKRLETLGLLQRERQTDDERVVLVALTPDGVAQVEAWQQRRRELLSRLVGVLDPHEQEQMQRILARVLDAVAAREGAAAGSAGGRRANGTGK